MRERDDAEDFIDALLDEVLGHERPEWSNLYGRADALNDVQERMTSLHKPAVDKAWGQFQSAMAAPQPAPESIRSILVRCREFIDTTKVPAYPSGADLADEIDVLLAAQPAAEASRFGSPELQAMIIARCVEKDRAASVQEDAALWRWLAEYLVGTRTDLDDEIVASETVNDLRKLVEAAIKQGEKQ